MDFKNTQGKYLSSKIGFTVAVFLLVIPLNSIFVARAVVTLDPLDSGLLSPMNKCRPALESCLGASLQVFTSCLNACPGINDGYTACSAKCGVARGNASLLCDSTYSSCYNTVADQQNAVYEAARIEREKKLIEDEKAKVLSDSQPILSAEQTSRLLGEDTPNTPTKNEVKPQDKKVEPTKTSAGDQKPLFSPEQTAELFGEDAPNSTTQKTPQSVNGGNSKSENTKTDSNNNVSVSVTSNTAEPLGTDDSSPLIGAGGAVASYAADYITNPQETIKKVASEASGKLLNSLFDKISSAKADGPDRETTNKEGLNSNSSSNLKTSGSETNSPQTNSYRESIYGNPGETVRDVSNQNSADSTGEKETLTEDFKTNFVSRSPLLSAISKFMRMFK